MNLLNIPFTRFGSQDVPRPWLPVTIINPDTNQKVKVYGLIDTGADECAFPANFAVLLGHNLQGGYPKEISTENGITLAYSHTVKIEVANFVTQDILIDFMPNLHIPLLGVKSFLSNFLLTIDYPGQTFSLKKKKLN